MSEQVDMQNERSIEQGFVMDINKAIEDVSQEDIGFKEKFKKLITMRFSIEQASNVNDYIEKATQGTAKCSDELYNIAILNEQIVDENSDEDLKEEFEKRHNELVEALMNRMEGVFKMYEEDLNVLTENSAVERPSDVQTPQIEEYNPIAPQVEEYNTPEITMPEETAMGLTDLAAGVIPEVETPVDYIEPADVEPEAEKEEQVVETEIPTIDPTAFTEMGAEESEVNEEAQEVPTIDATEFSIPEVEDVELEGAAMAAGDEFQVGEPFSIPTTDGAEYQAPEQEQPEVAEGVKVETPEASLFDEAATTIEPPQAAEETEEDVVVRSIRENSQRLCELQISLHEKEIRLAKLQEEQSRIQAEMEEVRQSMDNDQDELREIKSRF